MSHARTHASPITRAPLAALAMLWGIGLAPAGAMTLAFAQAHHPFAPLAGAVFGALLVIGACVGVEVWRERRRASAA